LPDFDLERRPRCLCSCRRHAGRDVASRIGIKRAGTLPPISGSSVRSDFEQVWDELGQFALPWSGLPKLGICANSTNGNSPEFHAKSDLLDYDMIKQQNHQFQYMA
jgi:hypothetical protein